MVTVNAAAAVTATFTHLPVTCVPRPSVQVSTSPSGAGRLQVTITATGTNNTLSSIQFGNPVVPVNAAIDIGALVGAEGTFTYPVPGGTTQVSFTVRRPTPGATTTTHMVVTDQCGAWPTFVGGGPT